MGIIKQVEKKQPSSLTQGCIVMTYNGVSIVTRHRPYNYNNNS